MCRKVQNTEKTFTIQREEKLAVKKPRTSSLAFTLVEILVLVALLAILAATFLPALEVNQQAVRQAQCLNNLKRIGLGFHAWMHNHGDKTTWNVSYTDGGASPTSRWGLSGQAFRARYFVCSNEMEDPKILTCPTMMDPKSAPFDTWAAVVYGTNASGAAYNYPLGYFLINGVDIAKPTMIFCGDQNLNSMNSPGMAGDYTYTLANYNSAWWEKAPPPAMPNGNPMHMPSGDLLLADLSVQKTSQGTMRKLLYQSIVASGGPSNIVNKP